MRTEDLKYLRLLERFRRGECDYSDCELLQTRVVGQPIVGSRSDISERGTSPPQSQSSNSQSQATRMRTNGMRRSRHLQRQTLEDPVLIRKMLELSDSKTEHLPGLLPFVPGMPVILTHNIAIELGVINGVNGIFRQLFYQVDSVSTEIRSNTVNRTNILARYKWYTS